MSSGLKIRISTKRTLVNNSGASSSIQPQPSSSVEHFKLQPSMDDIEMKEDTEHLPRRKCTVRSRKMEKPGRGWNNWEIDFLHECFKTTPDPAPALRCEWALMFTEKRLQDIIPSPEDKENLAKNWHSTHRRSKLKGETLLEEYPEGLRLQDDEACPVPSPSKHSDSVTIVQGITILDDQCDQEEQYEKEYQENELEEEIDELAGDTLDAGWILDDEVLRKGTRHISTHLHNLLQHPVPKTDPPI